MQAYYGCLVLGPTSFDGGGGGGSKSKVPSWSFITSRGSHRRFRAWATVNDHWTNHYQVLGVSPNASFSDIKKAYRLLALKHHPDVNKEVGSDEDFKSIRLAYDILINETTRSEYDKALGDQRRPLGDEYEDGLRLYRWAYLRRKMQREKYDRKEDEFSYYDDGGDASEEENQEEEDEVEEERGSFMEVVRGALLSVFLMQTVGTRLSLTYTGLMALIDRKLDAGYKFGYLFAWIMGGRGGILLTMFLSFASWVCGKTSSSVVAVVVVAMWFGSNIARYYGPLPQGALLTLLHMSIKLQLDLT
ncbi:hypothetical protein ABFX02_11G000600 [Erythranthe guttata]